MAHLWYGWALIVSRRVPDAIAQAQAAHELDPLSLYVETGLGQMYYYAGDPREAVQRIRRVVESDPAFFPGRYYLGVAYLFAKDYTNAIHELEAAAHLDPQSSPPAAYLAYSYTMLRKKEQAGAWSKRLDELQKTANIPRYLLAIVQAGLGDHEQAINLLKKAYQGRDDMLPELKFDPVFDSLHSIRGTRNWRAVSIVEQPETISTQLNASFVGLSEPRPLGSGHGQVGSDSRRQGSHLRRASCPRTLSSAFSCGHTF